MSFTSNAQPFQRADDVGYAITEFMWFKGRPYYPVGALADAKIACVRLSAGDFDETDEDNLDLIFRMREADGGHFFEVVLRSNQGTAYGGWVWGREIEILNEFVNGYRVLATTCAGSRSRFEYCQDLRRYKCIGPAPMEKASFTVAHEKTAHPNILPARIYKHQLPR
ncbi:hypothetical protein [Rhizobium terrae]|uniref:hypothetical protein n=1 Tax=Rhizobium terrae TaxID=2171756 RepID=UPI0038575EF8